jgi:hypothetical protein
MAATLVTTGVPQEVGVRYTYITDVEADWASVPISTYFYDLETKLPYYKNADNEVLNIFASGGGDSIYTADGALTGNRAVDLDNNILTFDVGTFSGVGVDKGLIIDGSDYQITNTNETNSFLEVFNENGTVFNAMQRGGILSYSDVNPLAFLLSRDSTKGLKLDTNNSRISTNELIFNNSFSGNQGIYLRGSGVTNDLFFRNSSNQIQHWVRQGDSLAIASFFYSGMNGKGFIVGGSSAISTEDISLQGSTLITEKLELSTTTDGFLMPRLTTAQKIAIPTPDTHLMVFDTDLGTIERYDGFNWVTQSGTGALGISGASGDYTYYPNYNTAIAAASSGDTIEQFGNIVETGAVAVDITKNLTIQMNGYSYTLDNAGTDRAFTVTGVSLSDIKILNGTINRINGTGGGALAVFNNTTTKPTLSLEGTTLYCDLAGLQTLLYVSSRYTVTGGLFKGPGSLFLDTDTTLTNFVYNGEGSIYAFRSRVMVSNGYIFTSGSATGLVVSIGAEACNVTVKVSGTGVGIENDGKISNCEAYSSGSVGIYSSTNASGGLGVFNCFGYSNGSHGIQISGGVCYNSVGRSTVGNGIWADLRGAPEIVNCVGWSSATAGIYAFSSGTTGKFVNCYAESELNTTSGHAFLMDSGTTKFINCTAKTANAGAFGIKGSSATASIVNFSGIGMASLFDSVTNAQIETTDAYGNVLVV